MTGEGHDRGGSYRRRLARAAAASFAVHMLFFGGLSVSRLDLAVERSAEPRAEKEPKRAADFRLQVSRSAPTEKPAHEQPLSLDVPAEAAKPAESRERPAERSVADGRDAPPEPAQEPTPTELRFERSRSEEAPAEQPRAAAERLVDMTPSAPTATADMPEAAATIEAAAAAAAAPAAPRPRDRGDAGPVAARWRPREVALLERLTARAPEATALAARPEAEAARSESVARQMPTAAPSEATARAEPIAAAAVESSPAMAAAAPAARDGARRPAAATATTSRPAIPTAQPPSAAAVAATSTPVTSVTRSQLPAGPPAPSASGSQKSTRAATVTAGAASGTAAVGPAGGGPVAVAAASGAAPLAPAASTGGRPERQATRGPTAARGGRTGGDPGNAAADGGGGSEAAGIAGRIAGGGAAADLGDDLRAGRGAVTDGGSETAPGSRSPGRMAVGLAADATGAGSVAPIAAPRPVETRGESSDRSTAAQVAAAGPALGPAAVDRAGRRAGGRSAAVASRGGGAAAADDGEEGLSISPADLASLSASARDRGGLPTQTPVSRSPERIAAAALPTDGRVRDVAEAFASRGGGGGEPAGGISDRETLSRARAMVDRGLEFLARSQLPDGRWRLTEFAGVTPADVPKLDSDTAATGLALLCFLGAGHDHFAGPHRDTVRRGLEFLLSVQKEDGDLFLRADDLSYSCSWLYSHGIASIAICEAVGMTGDPLVRPAAEKACRFIATSRHPTLGGWRYFPRTDADLSVSGWMLVALRAGELAGVRTDPAALGGVRTLLAASASPTDPTRFAYNARKADQRQNDLSVACMTAVGALMRLHTGAPADDPGVVASAKVLAGFPPIYGTRSQRVRDSYLWYYASQVLVHTGGDDWQAWYASLVDTLERPQHRDGPLAGSWDALGDVPDRWGEFGGRVYVTTLNILALEVPWRRLPTAPKPTGP